ncbi:monocarboxylate transporter 12 [Biomphalaria glabrata]|nr:monocarboxylate transporter 12-like [Biomphalaria glabrata]KAI8770510.1 monocarboxylate transporter 12 [Biomphalaria glabrata]
MNRVITKPPPPIDRGWAWMIVLGVFICTFFMVGIAKSYGLFLLAFRNEFQTSTSLATMPMSVASFVYAFGAPTALLLAEKFTAQKVVIAGATIGLIGIALSSLLFSMPYVIVLYGLCVGMANSSFFGNGLVMIGKYFRKYRSLATGVGLAGASIGQFAMPPIIQILLDKYSLSGTLLIVSALYFHVAVAGALFRPIEKYGPPPEALGNQAPKEEQKELLNDIKKETVEPGESVKNGATVQADDVVPLDESREDKSPMLPNQNGSDVDMKAVLSSTGSIHLLPSPEAEKPVALPKKGPRWQMFDFKVLYSIVTLLFTLVSFLVFFGYFNFIIFLPSVLKSKGIEHFNGALLISICGAGDLIARIGTGILADTNIIARYKLKSLACFLCGVTILIFLFTDKMEVLGVLSFLYGFFGGAYVILFSVVLLDLVGLSLMSKNLAVVLLVQGVGASVGQIFLGMSRDATGSHNLILILCSLTMIVGGVLLFAYPLFRKCEEARLQRLERRQMLNP